MLVSNEEDEVIRNVLLNYKNIATVGFSKDPRKPAHYVPKFMISRGYNVIPINPNHEEILGRKCYPSILSVPERIDIVQIFRPSNEVPRIVDESIRRYKIRGDVRVIWMQEGIRDDTSARLAKSFGLIVIQDKCMYKEYVRLIY
ncbi:MAG: CoA-binding protein [Sulfolobaceae archaeon]